MLNIEPFGLSCDMGGISLTLTDCYFKSQPIGLPKDTQLDCTIVELY